MATRIRHFSAVKVRKKNIRMTFHLFYVFRNLFFRTVFYLFVVSLCIAYQHNVNHCNSEQYEANIST